MPATPCAVCRGPTETGVRGTDGVVCPRCAVQAQGGALGRAEPCHLRTVGGAGRDTEEQYALRKNAAAIVEAREEFHSKTDTANSIVQWIHFQLVLLLALVPPAIFYVRWQGWRVFAYILAGGLLWSLGGRLLALFQALSDRRRLVIRELESEGAYRRYRCLREDARRLDPSKQGLLKNHILPKLKAMMEEKLPYLMQRRFEFASFLRAYRLSDLESEVESLARRLDAETDAEMREALQKRLALARARLSHFGVLEKRLRLYQIHLENLESHMENLVARVVMLDPNEDSRRASEQIMHGVTEELEVLEEAYREVSLHA